jgi:hypothetical protein
MWLPIGIKYRNIYIFSQILDIEMPKDHFILKIVAPLIL